MGYEDDDHGDGDWDDDGDGDGLGDGDGDGDGEVEELHLETTQSNRYSGPIISSPLFFSFLFQIIVQLQSICV